MNETTIFEKRPTQNGQEETKKEGSAWKQVTLGGVSGILMGAGLLYGGQVTAQELEKEEKPEDVAAPEPGNTSHTLENGLQVAAVSDDMSFGEAFEAARAEVGPGGVFHWHGGIYNTYSADEWNNMSVEQKHDFAQQVQPEIRPDELSTPTDANTHVVVEHHVYHHDAGHAASTTSDVKVVEHDTADTSDADVHIVGYGEVEGHLAVGLDTNNDGQTDVAIIDVDDSGDLSAPDVVIDDHGNMATIGDIANAQDPNMTAAMENPDMDTANVDDVLFIDA